jgi:prophage maintenance system killer protein
MIKLKFLYISIVAEIKYLSYNGGELKGEQEGAVSR